MRFNYVTGAILWKNNSLFYCYYYVLDIMSAVFDLYMPCPLFDFLFVLLDLCAATGNLENCEVLQKV